MHLRATASRAATLLAKNPGLFCRVTLGKLATARPMPALPARRRIGEIEFECDLQGYRGTAPMYFGSYAPLVVETMTDLLRRGDVVLDVGANVGYLSAVAANLVGPEGQVHAFEPVPAYFVRLRRLAELNPRHAIFCNPCAAGDSAGMADIFLSREAGQSTLVPGYQSPAEIIGKQKVPVVRLDQYIAARRIGRVAMIKIDTEGFELPVLRGLEEYFAHAAQRPPVVCEIAPRAYGLSGSRPADVAGYMARFGYAAFDLIDGRTRVDVSALRHVEDVLFRAPQSA
jgi:FkbM family methyltransferase